MRVRVGSATHVGLQRQRNEDSHAVYVPWSGEANPFDLDAFLLVADGMGGERGGDRASGLVCERLKSRFTSRPWPDSMDGTPLDELVYRGFVEVGQEVLAIGREDPDFRGIGTTAVLLLIRAGEVTVAHVGDSRCYRVRGDRIERLTVDHTWVERQVEAGILSREQAAHHPQRNILVRSIGDEDPPPPDLRREAMQVGDLFVLCSDGLTGEVEDGEILATALELSTPQEIAERLVERANEVDGSDNVTVVVARFEADDPATDEVTQPTLAVPPEPASERRMAAAALLAFFVGLAGGWLGTARPWKAPEVQPPGIEERARALLEEGERLEADYEIAAALECYQRVRALFQDAESVSEAERRIERLSDRLPPTIEDPPDPDREPSGPVE